MKMNLIEMEGFLHGKCLPGDMLVNETNAQYLVRKISAMHAQRIELEAERDALVVENAGLKANLMFWDAEDPESPYDTPEEIAQACSLNYGDEFVVQVAAKLPNRTYRVLEDWDCDCKVALVDSTEVETPATDRFIAEVTDKGRIQGINFAASRLAAAFNHGFVDKPMKEVGDVVRMILDAKADLANAPIPPADGLSGEYAEQSLKDWEEQLREAK